MPTKINPVNLDIILKNMEKWQKEGESLKIDLSVLGYNKLLGRGIVKNKLKITVDYVTPIAKAKVEEKGGAVITKEEKE